MAASNVTFTQRLLESLYAYATKDFVQNAFDQHRALDIMVKGGRPGFHNDSDAGNFLALPVTLRKIGITQMITDGSDYALGQNETGTAAKYDWRLAVSPLQFTYAELSENAGKQAIISTMQYKLREARIDHGDKLDDQMINGLGTGNETESLNTLVGTTDNGGIQVASFPNWKGQVLTAQAFSIQAIDAAIDSTNFGGGQGCDVTIMNLDTFQAWKELTQAKTTLYQQSTDKNPTQGLAGLKEVIQYRNAVFIWDRKAPLVTMYGLDTSLFHFYTKLNQNMRLLEAKQSPLALSQHIPVVTELQFATSSRRSMFKSSFTSGIPAA